MLTLHATGRPTGVGATMGDVGRMTNYVLGFNEIDQSQVANVGGKGVVLGELSRIDGIRVPDGFCVTTDAVPANHGGRAVH